MVEALKHADYDKKEDAALAEEARAHLAKSPPLQLVVELYAELRGRTLAWWTPDGLRTRYAASERMKWLRERADVRQQITTSLTGLVPRAARKKDPEFQAGLLDAAIDDGDVSTKAFEEAFTPEDLVVYGPAADYWRQFRMRMPWNQDVPAHQEIVAFVLRALLLDKPRRPILTPWELRTAIASKVWHSRIPVDVRAAMDDARLEREKKGARDPWHAKDDLAIAGPDVMAQNIPIREFARVLDVAERAMGFEGPAPEVGVAPAGEAAGPPTVNPGAAPNGQRTSAPPRPPPPPLRSPMHSAPGSAAPPPVGSSASDATPTPPPPIVSSLTHDDVLFEVDLASTDDVAAALDRIEGERPAKA